MANKVVEYCGNCRFSEYSGVSKHHALCRRHAPQPISITNADENKIMDSNQDRYWVVGIWPTVERDNWCGEYQSNGQE